MENSRSILSALWIEIYEGDVDWGLVDGDG